MSINDTADASQRVASGTATIPNSAATNGAHTSRDSAPNGAQTFAVSIFSGLSITAGKAENWNLDDLRASLSDCDIRPNKDGKLFSPAIYAPGKVKRANENVIAVSALVADCDESHTLAEVRAIIKRSGAWAIIVSSHSNGTVKDANAHAPGERYRVVFPLETPIDASDFPDVWERFNLLFDSEMDQACSALAQAYFLPSHPTGDGFVFEQFDGDLITPDDLPQLPEDFKAPNFTAYDVSGTGTGRPGDDFNARATNEETAQILESHDWRVTRSSSHRWKAKRPGKNGRGISATIGHYGPGILHVFTSNAAPFEATHAYRPFQVFGLLEHGGDFKAAARELGARGYGEKSEGAKVGSSKSKSKAEATPEPEPEPEKILSPDEIRAAFKAACSHAAPIDLAELIAKYRKWMFVKDDGLIKVTLATFAANLCDGDPVWLMIVGGSSSGKTETINPLAALQYGRIVGTLTESSFLSGSSKRDTAKNASGGLLREMGSFGVMLMKDFTSILSIHHDKRMAILAALREIYDGYWARDIGNDGGRCLEWRGKIGIIGCCTDAIESAHAVAGAMGERFVRYRLTHDNEDQRAMTRLALRRAGRDSQMRAELEEAVVGFFGALKIESAPNPLTEEQEDRLISIAMLTAKARSVVDRDAKSREIELTHEAEIPTRLAAMLGRILHGLLVIGVNENEAWAIVQKVALDSIPKLRAEIIRLIAREMIAPSGNPLHAGRIQKELKTSTQSTRRALEELRAHMVLDDENITFNGNRVAVWKFSELGESLWNEGFSPFPEKSPTPYSEQNAPAQDEVSTNGDLLINHPNTVADDFSGKGDSGEKSAAHTGDDADERERGEI